MCVQEFSKDALRPLRGVQVSDYERKKFNGIAARIRELGFSSGTYEDSFNDYGSDEEEKETDALEGGLGNPQIKSDGRKNEHQDDGEVAQDEVPALLEHFMNEVDDTGKHLIFSTLNAAMEECERNREKSKKTSNPTTIDREAAAGTSAGKSSTPTEPRAAPINRENLAPRGVTETLEQLAEELKFDNLSYDEIMSRLPEELVRDFEGRLRDGRVSRLVATWKPWWVGRGGAEDECHRGEDNAVDELVDEGQLPPLPNSGQLLVPPHVPKKNASELVLFGVVDVLTAYCLTMRLYNGDWAADAPSASRTFWELSAAVAEDARYQSLQVVCSSCVQRCLRVGKCGEAAYEALHDVAAVLSGASEWVVRALYECQRMLESALADVGRSSAKKELRARVRKIAYLVSWGLCQESDTLAGAARGVAAFADLEAGRNEEIRIAARAVRLSTTGGGSQLDIMTREG